MKKNQNLKLINSNTKILKKISFDDLDKKIKKIESLKIINLIMSYTTYREDNKMLKYVSRNISIWKTCLLIIESFLKNKKISEKDIILNIQCSPMTANTYIKELIELDFIYFEIDKIDKRKKNIYPSELFINEINIFFDYLKKEIVDLSFL
tara:strand:+ start:69 stop:521 length:453 start_codon:yes stop_codon:yes gene_type:complete